jgi:hypothetical protein
MGCVNALIWISNSEIRKKLGNGGGYLRLNSLLQTTPSQHPAQAANFLCALSGF